MKPKAASFQAGCATETQKMTIRSRVQAKPATQIKKEAIRSRGLLIRGHISATQIKKEAVRSRGLLIRGPIPATQIKKGAIDVGAGTLLEGAGKGLSKAMKARQGSKAVKVLKKIKNNETVTESDIKVLENIELDEKGRPIQKKGFA